MFDIGFLELIIIGIVALIVVGPKDLPGMFRQAGRFMGKMRGMAREFQRSMEEAADDSGLKEAASALRSTSTGLNSATRSAQSYAKKMLDETDEAAKPETAPPADDSAPKPPAPAAADGPKPAAKAPETAGPAQESAATGPDKES